MTNYNQSCIYKIASKDAAINNIYIGSTCNFIKRRNQHKTVCNNPNSKDHNMYVYRFIRNNGGWGNWNLYIIEQFNCTSKIQKEQVERAYIEELKPSLNKRVPANYQTNEVYNTVEYSKGYYESHKAERKEYQQKTIHCTHCNHMINLSHKARHNKTKKHISNSSTSSSETSSEEDQDTMMTEMNKLHDDNELKLQEIQNTCYEIDKLIN